VRLRLFPDVLLPPCCPRPARAARRPGPDVRYQRRRRRAHSLREPSTRT